MFLTVPPSLTTRPSDQTLIENQEVKFLCAAIGNPTPTITWIRDGNTLAEGETLSLKTNRSHSGKYWCSASNGLGAAVNASADLDVQCKYGNVVAMSAIDKYVSNTYYALLSFNMREI